MNKTSTKYSAWKMLVVTLFIIAPSCFQNVAAQELQVVKNSQLGSLSQIKETSFRPKPLTAAQKIQIIQKILDSKVQKVSSLSSPVILSVKNMDVSLGSGGGSAIIHIHKPLVVNPRDGKDGAAKFPPSDNTKQNSKLVIILMPTSIDNHLIDLTVSAAPKTKFVLSAGDNIMGTTMGEIYQQHLLFIVQRKPSDPWIYMVLHANDNWVFHSCEISQIK